MLIDEYARNYAFEEEYWWFVGRRQLVTRLLLPLLKGGEKRRLLDVGCGTGYTMSVLGEHAIAYGIDIAEEAMAYCRRRGLQRLSLASATSLPFADDSLDVVTALDVLEHLDDDAAALREWRRVCRPGGYLLVHVPALQWLWSGEDYVSQHRRRYDSSLLRRRVEEAGLTVRRLTYANTALLPAMIGTIAFNRAFNHSALRESNLRPLPAWLNRLLTGVFSAEVKLLTRASLPIGSSLVCLAQKPGPPSGGRPESEHQENTDE